MDNEKTADVEPADDQESVEDFKQDVENDPSTANPPGDDPDDLERARGG